MPTTFKHIAVIGRQRMPGVADTIENLISFLKQPDVDLVVEKNTADMLSNTSSLTIKEKAEFAKDCDLVIVVGGDGSLIHAAHCVIDHDVPILGVNRGRLGFLTDINPSEIETQITQVLSGKYIEEKRFLLHALIKREGVIEAQENALNEVVLYAGDVARMIEFEIYIDGKFVSTQRSDGLIIATPTGSTAYALSAGGPILEPGLEAIVLVPMFPHTLSNRPIVINSHSEIEIYLSPNLEAYPGVSCDGQAPILLSAGDRIFIRKYETPLRLIHPLDHNHYKTLREKLQWGRQWERAL